MTNFFNAMSGFLLTLFSWLGFTLIQNGDSYWLKIDETAVTVFSIILFLIMLKGFHKIYLAVIMAIKCFRVRNYRQISKRNAKI